MKIVKEGSDGLFVKVKLDVSPNPCGNQCSRNAGPSAEVGLGQSQQLLDHKNNI